MENISWANRVSNEVLHTVKEERNIVHTIQRREDTMTGYILRRNCLLKENTSLKEEWKDRSDGKAKKMVEGAAG